MPWGPFEVVGKAGSCEPIVCFWALVGGLCEALCPVEDWGVSWFFFCGGFGRAKKNGKRMCIHLPNTWRRTTMFFGGIDRQLIQNKSRVGVP